MLSDYLPIVILAVLAFVFAVGSLAASAMLRPHKPTPVKLSAYECGNDPVRLPRGERFSVRFYVVAMLFIIFDIETIFLFPWAVTFRQLGMFGLIEMAVFIALVFVAYVYIWKKGGLDWSETVTPVDEPILARHRGGAGAEQAGQADDGGSAAGDRRAEALDAR
jgi:NADH-quinone oxidoreductase subunit A